MPPETNSGLGIILICTDDDDDDEEDDDDDDDPCSFFRAGCNYHTQSEVFQSE